MKIEIGNSIKKQKAINFTKGKEITPEKLRRNLNGAIRWRRAERVELWLKEGANIGDTSLSKLNENAFHKTAKYNEGTKILKSLLQELETNKKYAGKEAEILNCKNIYGKTPLSIALERIYPGNAKILLDHPKTIFKDEYLLKAINKENSYITKYILMNFTNELKSTDKNKVWDYLVQNVNSSRGLPMVYPNQQPNHKYSIDELKSMTKSLINLSSDYNLKFALDRLIKEPENTYNKIVKDMVWKELLRRI